VTAQEPASDRMLLCQVGSCLCGFPIEHIAETMRPLPVESLAGAPSFVLGLALIRGVPTPVIDLDGLLFEPCAEAVRPGRPQERAAPSRFVTLKTGARRAAVAIASVIGVRALSPASLVALPPLFRDVRTDFVEAIGMLDGDLFLALESARIVPPAVWTALEARRAGV
jgi:purine-binding chemotaxis protein CheW